MLAAAASKFGDIIASILGAIFKSTIGPFLDIDTFEGLIFGTYKSGSETIYFNTFTESELLFAYLPISRISMSLAVLVFVVLIVIGGMRLSSSGMNAQKRNEGLELTKDLFIVGVGLSLLGTLYSIIFGINSSVVDFFEAIIGSSQSTLGVFEVEVDFENASFSNDSGFIGTFLITVAKIGLMIWANFYYLMRKLTLIILMGAGPIFLVMWMLPQWKGITVTWLKELVGTIFIQSIHCFVFYVVLVMSVTQNVFIQVLIMALFIPISEQLRGLLGMGGNMVGALNKSGSMMGMAALGTMYGAVKGAVSGGSVMDGLRSLKNGGKNFKDKAKDVGLGSAISDTASKAKDALFADGKKGALLKAGDFLSKGGKAVGGSLGAIAGMATGAQGALIGGVVGGAVGGVGSGLVGRTAAATGQGIATSVERGKANVANLNDSIENGDKNVVEEIANQKAASWGKNNKPKSMEQLRKNFPSASEAELEGKYNDMVSSRRDEFLGAAQSDWASVKKSASEVGKSAEVVKQASHSMANTWAANNEGQFKKDFEKSNPKRDGESDSDYATRQNNAFAEKKNSVREGFASDGASFAKSNQSSNGLVNKADLSKFMASNAQKIPSIGNVAGLEAAAIAGLEHVSGAALFNSKGIPNMGAIASGLAKTATAGQKPAFMAEQASKNIPLEQAEQNWQAGLSQRNADNFATYNTEGMAKSLQGISRPAPTSIGAKIRANTAEFSKGAINTEAIKAGSEILTQSLQAGSTTLKTNLLEGKVFSAVPNMVKSAQQAGVNAHIEQHGGDAVMAQRSLVGGAGYAAAILGGRNGMAKAHQLMEATTNYAGYGSAVQTQVSSPAEMLQMAHKVTDDFGNQAIAPGAIRHVTTREGSHVEVRTQSGELRTVSRIGAGNETMKPGEVIYQDLHSSDGKSLEIASVGRSGISTYKVDSGGAKLAFQADVQNPLNMLGDVNSGSHAQVQRKVAPVLAEAVDSGKFYTEDLAKGVNSGSYKNVQMIIDKEQQYLTAQDGQGVTWRVSPISKGDARLNSSEVRTIPMQVSTSGGMRPIAPPITATSGEIIGVDNVGQTQNKVQTVVKQVQQKIMDTKGSTNTRSSVEQIVEIDRSNPSYNYMKYYNPTLDFEQILPSRNREVVENRLIKRQSADKIRRRQGNL